MLRAGDKSSGDQEVLVEDRVANWGHNASLSGRTSSAMIDFIFNRKRATGTRMREGRGTARRASLGPPVSSKGHEGARTTIKSCACRGLSCNQFRSQMTALV
jgi:hypothetical protein